MKWKKWLENWDMTGLKLKTPFLEMEWNPQTADQNAAWDLYIEMLTRITTQSLPVESGDEKAALDSVYSLFPSRAASFVKTDAIALSSRKSLLSC